MINLLKIAPKKDVKCVDVFLESNFLLLLNMEKISEVIFTMLDLAIPNASEVNCLDVVLDPRLQWGKHIESVSKKLNKSLCSEKTA